jgi:hypothetical protein
MIGPERLAALSSLTELAAKVEWLREIGPRETGNPNHVRFVEWIGEQLASFGLQVRRDSHTFDRWSVLANDSRCALAVQNSAGDTQTVAVSSAYPYSGRTGPGGVTGSLQLVGCGWRRWKDAAGKIAVVEVPNPSAPRSLLFDDVGHIPVDSVGFRDSYPHPVVSATVFGPDLVAAKAAGAIGVVAVWKGLAAAQAADQYVPFTFPYRDIPAIWVAGEAGKQLLHRARQGARATLTLDATLSPCATTDTLWTVVQGEATNESILVVTHTDGVNSVEENGAIGVLELARMFANGLRPKRTLIFLFITGHLRIPAVTDHTQTTTACLRAHPEQATTAWLRAHPEWWSGRDGASVAVAGLVIEHLGALAQARCGSGDRVEPDVELTYATNEAMQEIVKKSWAGRQRGKVLIAQPGGLIHFGEGEPLYKRGIPAIALVTAPEYLLATTKADLVDIELMHEQIGAFARALMVLESTPTKLLGKAAKVGGVKKVFTVLRFIAIIARVRWGLC